MEHYVTLFDSLFLPQAVALHASLQRHAPASTLWMLCVDIAAHEVLARLGLPGARLIPLSEVESPELARVKPTRTRGEYCWTLTPFSPGFVFERDPAARRVTYVDADMWFRTDPRALIDELGRSGKSVLITEHAYAPEYDQAATSGRFCVQFITFVRGRSDHVRDWWAQRCLEWCHARLEGGKFGDQMYLNDWPQRFGEDVHVLQERALLQAPWNATRFAPNDAAAFHFHGLRLLPRSRVLLSGDHYRLPQTTVETIYRPYVAELRRAIDRLQQAGHEAMPQASAPTLWSRVRGAPGRAAATWQRMFPPRVLSL